MDGFSRRPPPLPAAGTLPAPAMAALCQRGPFQGGAGARAAPTAGALTAVGVDASVELLPDAPPSRRPLLFSQTVAMATKAAKKVTAKKAAPRKAAPRKASSTNSFYGPDRPKFL